MARIFTGLGLGVLLLVTVAGALVFVSLYRTVAIPLGPCRLALGPVQRRDPEWADLFAMAYVGMVEGDLEFSPGRKTWWRMYPLRKEELYAIKWTRPAPPPKGK